MPNLVTHYLCGLEAVKNIQNSDCKSLLQKYQNVFNLGAQGPDVLFYYEVWPWTKKTLETNIGQVMHVQGVNAFFRAFMDYILKQNAYVKNILTVYLMGFVCHNLMDSECHPYIFYRSGFKTEAKESENISIYRHRRFEVSIDVLLAKKFLNKKVHEINCEKRMELKEPEKKAIIEMFQSTIKTVYDATLSRTKLNKSIKDMLLVEKMLKDSWGIKKRIIGVIDNLLYGFPLFSSLIFPLKLDDGLDYLNLSKKEWHMPHDSSISSNRTFLDLFYDASQKTQKFCDLLYACIFGGNGSIPGTLKLLGNNSYLSGIDCEQSADFKYSDLIFEE